MKGQGASRYFVCESDRDGREADRSVKWENNLKVKTLTSLRPIQSVKKLEINFLDMYVYKKFTMKCGENLNIVD